MKYAKYLVLFIVLFFCQSLFSQSGKIDSLRKLTPTLKDDTNKVIALNALSEDLWRKSKYDTSLIVSSSSIQLADKLGYKKGKAAALRDAAIVQWYQGKYPQALKNQQEALMNTEIGYRHGISSNLGNMGSIYKDQGDYIKALDYYKQGLRIDEEEHDSVRLAGDYGNIGIIYHVQGDYPNSLEYYLKALSIAEKTGDRAGVARHMGNIGNVYADQGDTGKALSYYIQSLKIDKEIGANGDMAVDLGNIGNIYSDNKNCGKAVEYYTQSIELAGKLGDAVLQATNLGNLGNILVEEKKYAEAREYFEKGFKIDNGIGNKNGLATDYGYLGALDTKTGDFKDAEKYLKLSIALDDSMKILNDLRVEEEAISKLYDTTGQYKLALEYYKKSIDIKDTLFNKEKTTALARKELSYQFEKKEAAEKAEQDKKDLLAQADKRKEHIIIAAVLCGLLLVIVFSGFVLRSLRITRKQKENIEVKNKIIEEKNREVTDSINYAKRLQDAILPPVSTIKKYLPESFVLYKPKDIVAGDFYWVAPFNSPEGGTSVLVAAADCTGHGVPGAMVSVVCSNALNRAVKELHLTEPGKVLDKARELVLETFEKSEGEIKDGMDISLAAISYKPLANSCTIKWAGAYNPLWYIHNGEVKELVPDKQPIGKVDNPKPFTTHTITIAHPLEGSGEAFILYLFTDGYADQFGGDKGKKFKYKQLQQLIVDSAQLPMEEQKRGLDKALTEWQGNLEQVDDILVMGIRV